MSHIYVRTIPLVTWVCEYSLVTIGVGEARLPSRVVLLASTRTLEEQRELMKRVRALCRALSAVTAMG